MGVMAVLRMRIGGILLTLFEFVKGGVKLITQLHVACSEQRYIVFTKCFAVGLLIYV